MALFVLNYTHHDSQLGLETNDITILTISLALVFGSPKALRSPIIATSIQDLNHRYIIHIKSRLLTHRMSIWHQPGRSRRRKRRRRTTSTQPRPVFPISSNPSPPVIHSPEGPELTPSNSPHSSLASYTQQQKQTPTQKSSDNQEPLPYLHFRKRNKMKKRSYLLTSSPRTILHPSFPPTALLIPGLTNISTLVYIVHMDHHFRYPNIRNTIAEHLDGKKEIERSLQVYNLSIFFLW